MNGRFPYVVARFVGDHRRAAEVVLVDIVDAVGVDSGDSLAGGQDVFDVPPEGGGPPDLFETIPDVKGGGILCVFRWPVRPWIKKFPGRRALLVHEVLM